MSLPPLATVEDVEAITGEPVPDDGTDRVVRLLEMASAAVRRFCHQDWDQSLPLAAPVPDDVVGLVAAKVAGFVSGVTANPDGLRSLQVGAMSETYANAGGSEVAVGPGALTEAERNALRAGGHREQVASVLVGPPTTLVPRWPWGSLPLGWY